LILVDTGPLVALCNRRDPHHARATRELRRLIPGPRLVCVPVLVEAHFFLNAAHLRGRLGALLDDGTLTPRHPTNAAACLRYCRDWLKAYEEHAPDFTDAWLLAMAHADSARIWTFDREFETTWRLLDGSAVPRVRPGGAPASR